MQVFSQKDINRFWSYVDKTTDPNGCWIWTGTKFKGGYGIFGSNYKLLKSHRVSVILDGRDPTGLQVCHHCDNPSCVRPDHLFLGTNQDNMKDKCDKGRHKSGNREGKFLTEQEREEICRTYIPGLKGNRKELAKKFNVHTNTINLIIRKALKNSALDLKE